MRRAFWGRGGGAALLPGARVVARAKNARSAFSRHGSWPARPMPCDGVVATMRVRGGAAVGRGSGMVGVVVLVLVVDMGVGRREVEEGAVLGRGDARGGVGGVREVVCAKGQCSWGIEVVKDSRR